MPSASTLPKPAERSQRPAQKSLSEATKLPTAKPPGVAGASAKSKSEHKILFQTFFKSVGSRTYAAQVKEASNGNHYLVLTEGKRDKESGQVRKTRLFVYGEDFSEFFKMIRDAAQYIKANPLPEEFVSQRKKFWTNLSKRRGKPGAGAR